MGRPVGSLLLLLAIGCGPGGDGSSGDPRAEPKADPYGTGQRLSDVLGQRYQAITSAEDSWLEPSNSESIGCKRIPLDQETQITGVTLLMEDTFDETGEGAIGNYYVQDTGTNAPNSGITVFQPGFSPPDLRVVTGDVLDIFGLITEFDGPGSSKFGYCRTLPEMSGSVQLRFEGAVVEPAVIPVEDTATYVAARQWIGMLVRLENVELSETPFKSATGRYNIRFNAGMVSDDEDIPNISNELMDLEAVLPLQTMPGTVLSSVTGVMTYFYGVHIAPRTPEDIVP